MDKTLVQEIENLFAKHTQQLQKEMQVDKQELKGEIQTVRQELKGEIQTAKQELKDEMQGQKEELKVAIHESQKDTIEVLSELIHTGYTMHEKRIEVIEEKLHIVPAQ